MVLYGFTGAYGSCVFCLIHVGGSTFKSDSAIFHPQAMNTFNNKDEFERQLKESKRVLILFCASWCPFCERFFPVFDRLVAKNDFDKVLRVYIDDYENQLWEDYSIDAVPSVMLFELGKLTRRLDARLGFGLSEKTFIEWLKKL
jgi:thioredoxin 1